MNHLAENRPHLRRLFDGQMFEIQPDAIIGRHADCDIVLERERGASRKHARVTMAGADVYITDLGSLNGTLVNGREIEGQTRLATGDILVFDEDEYEILIPAAAEAPIEDVDPNVTVIANRGEIGKRHLIKPAIKVVDEEHAQQISEPAPAPPEPSAPPPVQPPEPAAPPPAAHDPSTTADAFDDLVPPALRGADEHATLVAPQAPAPAAAPPVAPEAPRQAPPPPPPMAPAAPPPPAPAPAPHPNEAAAAVEAARAAAVDAAPRPGAWANTSAVLNNPGRTMIAQQVVGADTPYAPNIDPSAIVEPTLLVQTGDHAGSAMALSGDRIEWTIGSGPDRDIRIAQSGISGNHAAIKCEGGKWKVSDHMSANGTFVNGNQTNISYIDNGDVLRFGPVECQFMVPAGFANPSRSGKKTGKRIPLWMLVTPVVILLILAGAYLAYSSGLLAGGTPPATTTGTQ